MQTFFLVGDMGYGALGNAIAQGAIATVTGTGILTSALAASTVLVGCVAGAIIGSMIRNALRPQCQVVRLDDYRKRRLS